jgi:hypothetical protein
MAKEKKVEEVSEVATPWGASDVAPVEKAAPQEAVAEAVEEGMPDVIVMVPKAFKLRMNDHVVIDYPAGAYSMPREHAEHWYAKANKVTIVKGQ